jgi:hypothetical protein
MFRLLTLAKPNGQPRAQLRKGMKQAMAGGLSALWYGATGAHALLFFTFVMRVS